MKNETLERFWRKVDRKQKNDCWNWIGSKIRTGYGQFKSNKKIVLAHRFSWELHFGKIPQNKPCVLHHCDNPKCVNPRHLFLGTQADNVEDMINKGRDNKARQKGEDNANHKLTVSQIKEIRSLKGKLTQKEIAKMFNVYHTTIEKIHNNKTWKHVK